MTETRSNRSGADETREALVQAGLTLFGRDGFAATSTRAIAAMAGTNVASIAYHFGGKEGLRQACAKAVASRISHVAGAAAQFDPGGDPQRAHTFLEGVIDRFIDRIIASPEGRSLSSFILREIGEQGAVFDVLLNRFITPVHTGLCRVFAAAAGTDPASADTRLAVFALAGQLLYFRIGQPVVLARMDWEAIGPAEREQLSRTVKANLAGMIAARRERLP
ncbi:CerR family C-terminal domain-containing protein [Zhengella sp. ZM62]|uniref:CerR family C-terminal domain-containing protein n=1 Tax=Zhengella sedimenti TaxID=3390035 RepID=UPI00397639AE